MLGAYCPPPRCKGPILCSRVCVTTETRSSVCGKPHDKRPAELRVRIDVQDHYENMYVVLRGSKTFTLKPPSSVHQMHLSSYPVWQECMHWPTHQFTSAPVPDGMPVRWCPIDARRLRTENVGSSTARGQEGSCLLYTSPSPRD